MSRKIRILIIDDDDISRNILKTLLEGHDLRLTADGSEAATLAQQHRPDIVLLNAALQGHDSLQIIRNLRQPDENNDTAILMMSSYDHPDTMALYLQAGVDDILLKPLHATMVNHTLQQTLNRFNARKQLRLAQQQITACELKLKAANEQRENFCRKLSHDLNNALTGIVMTAEMVLISDPSADTRNSMDEIIQCSDEITAIIKSHRAALDSE
ncbi:MAG: response regulator [Mariprofundus sp.]